MNISELQGKTFKRIDKVTDGRDIAELHFVTDTGFYRMFHEQDCCESVYLSDVVGELDDLINTPVLMAYEAKNQYDVTEAYKQKDPYEDSTTWTFYHLATIKGYVTLRWIGLSNGYYSEDVDLEFVPHEQSSDN